LTRPYVGPRLLMGTLIGVLLGLLGVFNIYLVGAAILIGLFLLGRMNPGVPRGQRMTPDDASDLLMAQMRADAECERRKLWERGEHGNLPGWQPLVHLDRPFGALTDCERGHYEVHPTGATFTRGDRLRIVRTCAVVDCYSVWTELV
jgi:hypothetical protein